MLREAVEALPQYVTYACASNRDDPEPLALSVEVAMSTTE